MKKFGKTLAALLSLAVTLSSVPAAMAATADEFLVETMKYDQSPVDWTGKILEAYGVGAEDGGGSKWTAVPGVNADGIFVEIGDTDTTNDHAIAAHATLAWASNVERMNLWGYQGIRYYYTESLCVKDISNIAETGYAVFKVDSVSGDAENAFFAIAAPSDANNVGAWGATKGNPLNYIVKGVKLTDYYDVEKGGEQIVAIPLKKFVSATDFRHMYSVFTEYAESREPEFVTKDLDLQYFGGMGIAKNNSSTGGQTLHMSISGMYIVSAPADAPTLVSAARTTEGVEILYTPVDGYEAPDFGYRLIRECANGEIVRIDLDGSMMFTDTTTDPALDYTYKIVSVINAFLDDVSLMRTEQWTAAFTDHLGNDLKQGTISANAQYIDITFHQPMNEESFISSNVVLADSEGNVINTFGSYDSTKNKYTLHLLENLKQNTAYQLLLKSVVSANGTVSEFQQEFQSDSSAITPISYKIPDITPEISVSKSGTQLTAAVSMPKQPRYEVKAWTMTLGFDSALVTLNGRNAVTVPEGVTYTSGENSITIRGEKNGAVLSGELAKIVFSAKSTGTAVFPLTGSAEVYNAPADAVTKAEIKATANAAVSSSSGSSGGGGSSSSSGGGSAADRGSGSQLGGISIPPKTEEEISQVSFADLQEVPWAADSILAMAKLKMISGYPDNTYRPNQFVTREELASLIVRLFSMTSENTDTKFTDIDPNAWYCKDVAIVEENGIVNGISENEFGIGFSVTREDMCVMIYNAMQKNQIALTEKYDKYVFADGETISAYARAAVDALYEAGVISGVSETEFNPKAPVTRAMIARVLYGVYQLME